MNASWTNNVTIAQYPLPLSYACRRESKLVTGELVVMLCIIMLLIMLVLISRPAARWYLQRQLTRARTIQTIKPVKQYKKEGDITRHSV